MGVLTLKNDEFRALPDFLQDYAHYTVTIKGNSDKTVVEYVSDVRTFFRYLILEKTGDDFSRDEFEKISVSEITLDTLSKVSSQSIINFLFFAKQELENGARARMRKLSAIKSLYKYLTIHRHYLENNPAANIEAPKKNFTLPKYLTKDEALHLLDTVRNDTASKTVVRDYSIICLFLNSGMRLSELVGLNIQSFDSQITRVKVVGKGNKEREIFLNHAAQEAVKAYLRIRLDPRYIHTSDKAFYLSGRQVRISPKTVQYIVNKYVAMAGYSSKGLSVHKLRHTAATLMYQSGSVDIRVLKDILGHEQLNTTQIYTHVTSHNIEEAMKANPLSETSINKKEK
jgi:site-specific recombinase XerD